MIKRDSLININSSIRKKLNTNNINILLYTVVGYTLRPIKNYHRSQMFLLHQKMYNYPK